MYFMIPVFWVKVLTSLIIAGYIALFRSEQFIFFNNLGYSRTRIFAYSFSIDFLIWLLMTGAMSKIIRSLIPSYLPVRKAFSLFNIPEVAVTEYFPETVDMMTLKPGELSGGYLRIFEILLVVKSAAKFCLLDEPFSGLTPVYIEKIKAILQAEKTDKGIIVTDHMHRHVTEISDRLYVLANGQTYAVSDASQLISLGYVNAL